MTKEELKDQVAALIDAAWDGGYIAGHKDALNNVGLTQPTEDEVEPMPEVVPEYSLENSAVEGFMLDQTYYAPGFATGTGMTVVDQYIKGAVEGDTQSWTEQQAKVPVKFDSIEGVSIVDGICNLVPGKVYTYFKNEGGNVVRGKFKTKPNTVRMITMADEEPVMNIRDLGGYKCEGGHVAYEKLIRSARLTELTKDSANTKILASLGITDEITFSSSCPARTEFGLWKGVYYGLADYVDLVTKTAQRAKVKSMFTRIVNDLKGGGTVLFHCKSGTDRTGSVSTLLLGLLGVSEGDLIKEWEMTCFCAWFNFVRISDWAKREDVRKDYPTGQLRQMFQKMKSSFGKNGETFQQQCEAFFKLCGVTTAQIADFKMRMIVPATK